MQADASSLRSAKSSRRVAGASSAAACGERGALQRRAAGAEDQPGVQWSGGVDHGSHEQQLRGALPTAAIHYLGKDYDSAFVCTHRRLQPPPPAPPIQPCTWACNEHTSQAAAISDCASLVAAGTAYHCQTTTNTRLRVD